MRLYIEVLYLVAAFLFLSISDSRAADYSMQLNDVRVIDLARIVYGDVLSRSYIFDDEAMRSLDAVSVDWKGLKKPEVEAMVRDILSMRGFSIEEKGAVLLVRKRDVPQKETEVLVYIPHHRSARYLADIVAKVEGSQQLGARGLPATSAFQQTAVTQQEGDNSAASVVDRSASDQLAFRCEVSRCDKLRKILEQIDTPEAQVILRAAVYEVGTTQGQGSAIQIAAKLLQGKLMLTAGTTLAGASQLHLSAPNLDAVLSVLDQDGRFKSISRPMLRVRTGSSAKFSVGQQVPVLGAISHDNIGNAIQSVEYRQSGTIFTVQPDVRQDVIDLNVSQELSSFIATTTGVNNSPTLLQRTANSQLSIKPGEVIVFAGLEEQKEDESGLHLFGYSLGKNKSTTSSEVLLFIEAERI